MKKKLLTLVLALALIAGGFGINAKAADLSADVFVTIANGSLVLTQEKITVTDINADGKLTIDDALYCTHEAKYTGGAAAGYASANSDWGLSLTKLWGIENGGSYGYYVNNTMSMGLGDEIKAGDYINAFVYTDLTAWSDTFCYFDVQTKSATLGEEFTLTLTALGFSGSYPVADAVITINGVDTAFKTNAEGKVTIKLDSAAPKSVISAKADGKNLVPPVCTLTLNPGAPATGEGNTVLVVSGLAVILCAALFVTRRRVSYEK